MKNLGPPDGTASAKSGHRERSGIPLTSKRSVMWFQLMTRKNSHCRGEFFARALVEVFITYLGGFLPLSSIFLVFLLLVVGDGHREEYGLRWRGSVGTRDLLFPLFSPHWTTNRIGILVFVALSSSIYSALLCSQGLKRPLGWFCMWDHDTRRHSWIYQEIHYSRYTWL